MLHETLGDLGSPHSLTIISQGKNATSLPLKCLYLLLACGFFVYIPVIYSGHTYFVITLDTILFSALFATILSNKKSRRLFGGSYIIFFSIFVYLINLLTSLFFDPAFPSFSVIQGMRSHLFGLIVFGIASMWINKIEHFDAVLKIVLICSIVAAIFGMKQILFGMSVRDIEHMSTMGSSVSEMEVLNRFRIPSVFGDPATYSFFMMCSVFIYILAQRRGILPLITVKLHPLILSILFISLMSTLTRAPLLGLFAGLLFSQVFSDKNWLKKLIRFSIIVATVLTVFFFLNLIVQSEILTSFNLGWLTQLNNMLSSLWSLFSMLFPGSINVDSHTLEMLSSLSSGSRSASWSYGIRFMLDHPMGGGLGYMTEGGHGLISFSTVDVGFIRYGIEVGFFGLLGILGLLGGVALVAVERMRRIDSPKVKNTGYTLLALWIAIVVANGVSGFLFVESTAVLVWIIAGLLVNFDLIALSICSDSPGLKYV